jgi:hypothetical protein
MSYNSTVVTSALTKYVDQLSTDLVREMVLQGRTQQFISVQTGVKYADALNIMTSNLVVQAAGCGLINATGSVTLTQNNLQVCPLMVEEQICLLGNNSLEQYWTGMTLKKGSYYDELGPDVFAKAYVADKLDKLQGVIDDLIWVGSSTGATYSTDPNMTNCNGFLKLIDGTYNTSVVTVGATNSTYPTPNGYTFSGAMSANSASPNYALNVVDAMALSLPQDLWDQEDLTLFLSYSQFRTYIMALRYNQPVAYNFPALESDGSLAYSIYHPGTNIRLIATRGLKYSTRMILTPAKNLYFGTDMQNDYESFRIWKSEDFNSIFFRAIWKQGVQVAYPQYIVSYNG